MKKIFIIILIVSSFILGSLLSSGIILYLSKKKAIKEIYKGEETIEEKPIITIPVDMCKIPSEAEKFLWEVEVFSPEPYEIQKELEMILNKYQKGIKANFYKEPVYGEFPPYNFYVFEIKVPKEKKDALINEVKKFFQSFNKLIIRYENLFSQSGADIQASCEKELMHLKDLQLEEEMFLKILNKEKNLSAEERIKILEKISSIRKKAASIQTNTQRFVLEGLNLLSVTIKINDKP